MTRASALALAGALLLAGCAASDEPMVVDGGDLQAAIDAAPDGAELHLAPGRYAGPVVITRPVTLVGGPGVVVEGPAEENAVSIVRTAEVTLRDIRIEGGSDGIFVRSTTGVVLDGIEVVGAQWHGIFAHDAEMTITGCSIRDLRAPMPQGIEIINSDGRSPSWVTGCRVEGPVFEGIVSHVSRVTFRDNVVVGSFQRGISVTEMSAGEVIDNQVIDARGTAYYCGDRSWCHFVGNRAEGVSPNEVGARSSEGHGLVVQFFAEAHVQGFTTRDIEGQIVLVMPDSALNAPLNRHID